MRKMFKLFWVPNVAQLLMNEIMKYVLNNSIIETQISTLTLISNKPVKLP